MKIVTIIGARPQFIKAAPVSRAIERQCSAASNSSITEVLVHTGQHYDHNMSQVFFDEFGLRAPQYNLGIGSGSHGEMTGLMLARIETVLIQEKPDWVLVYGDTNSTLAGALAAVKLHIPIAHVEAGLRSYNRIMPEEINRVLTDHMARLLFCPTPTAVANLQKEGITRGVHNIGDVMYDNYLHYREIALEKSSILSELELRPKSYCLTTIHRQENTDDPAKLKSILGAIRELASADRPFVVPLHPRTKKTLESNGNRGDMGAHVHFIAPVGYLDMIALQMHARVIMTDSGGVQKEAYFACVPCVTLREETEWVETIAAGWNHLGGTASRRILSAFAAATTSVPSMKPDFYGNGDASHRLLRELIANISG